MDSQMFRKETSPNLMPRSNQAAVRKTVAKMEQAKATYPIEDPRYPKHASIMEDGRFITDYKSHCATNGGDPRYGNSVRGFLQHNADALIQVSRKRQADRVGAQYQMANTVVEPKLIQKCDEYECTMSRVSKGGLGLERSEPVPELFGTFSQPTKVTPSPNVRLTTVFEGGRNTPHGRQYVPLGHRVIQS